ncbi:MAG: 50S ribosomal protein L11 methyltransferase [Desulfobacterales bacterium]|jgi:ribosomal protein L11 methyltransferase
MKWIEIKVAFDAEDNRLAGELISNLFFESDLTGVVEDDPSIEPADDWAEDAIGRPQQRAVVGYFPKDRQAKKRCRDLEQQLSLLKQNLTLGYRVIYKELDEEDWAEAWKAFFEPQKIGQKIVVKPTWRDYTAKPGDIVVELDPGMAFGTGTHPTTALCIRLIEDYLKKDDRFLDIGTGSGILMVAAAKLGAGFVCGLDKNEMAVKIAAENLRLNGIAQERFSVKEGNLVTGVEEKYHLVAANILTQVIYNLLEDIENILHDKAIFICSGILEKNENLVLARMKTIGFDILDLCIKDQWVAIAGRFTKRHKA